MVAVAAAIDFPAVRVIVAGTGQSWSDPATPVSELGGGAASNLLVRVPVR